jgi:hypothetical protein
MAADPDASDDAPPQGDADVRARGRLGAGERTEHDE